jgi:outer membrane protein assembly factor BamB
MSRAAFLGATLACAAALAAAPAADWPRFRGPNGSGAGDDVELPAEFDGAKGALWTVPIPGTGHSSPVVSGGKLFVQSAVGEGSERMLLCLDAATGKTLWARSQSGGLFKGLHKYNSLASSTPAVDGSRVYSLFWDGKDLSLTAYDFDGHTVWQQPIGPFKSQHGAGTSPVVYGDVVYLNYDQDGAAALLAFDAKTGSPLWHQERKPYRACYSSPVMRDTPAGPELIVSTTTALTGYDAKSGKRNWNWDWSWSDYKTPLRTVASPVVSGDLVFTNSGEGAGNSAAAAVEAGGPGKAPRLVWEKKKGVPYVTSMLAKGEHLFAVTDRGGVASCYVARTGREVWTERLGGQVFASPVLAGDKVVAVNGDGAVFVFRAADKFERLGGGDLRQQVKATPAVADGRLYVRGERDLFCFGKK